MGALLTGISKDAENTDIQFGRGHPNIMRLYDDIEAPRQLYLILESVDGQILNEVLRNRSDKMLSEVCCARIFRQIISALKTCHELKIAHRDLKPDNIMVDLTDEIHPIVKVIDFGFACQSTSKMNVFCGTPAYMSPEICQKGKYDGLKADMWATGILLYTMLFGK